MREIKLNGITWRRQADKVVMVMDEELALVGYDADEWDQIVDTIGGGSDAILDEPSGVSGAVADWLRATHAKTLDVSQAIIGDDGVRKRIAEAAVGVGSLLLRKNRAYGDSAFRSPLMMPELPPQSALLVRISDKLERLRNLMADRNADAGDESLDDTIQDLAGYFVLLMVSRGAE